MAEGNKDITALMEKDFQNKINYDTTELFNDMFDHFADEDDDYEDIGDLDFSMHLKAEDELLIDDYDDISVNDIDDNEKKIKEEEQVFSQKLSQLSTSKTKRQQFEMATGTSSKTMKKEEKNFEDLSPRYLSATNESWIELIEKQQWLKNNPNNNNNEEDLRHIAILMHKLAVNNLQIELWTTYLKSGTGCLKQPEDNESITHGLYIWPVKVKSFILSKRSTTNMNSDDENKVCQDFIYKYIRNLNEKDEQYKKQLVEKKKSFVGYTDVIEKGLQTYIEQQATQFLRWKCELKQMLVYNEYQNQILEVKYRQHNPDQYQKNVAQQLYNLKYDLEKAKQQVTLLKQRMFYNTAPNSFDSIDLYLPPSIDTIDDPTIRQRLLDRQEKIIQQTKTDLIAVFIAGAEATMRRCQKVFDYEMAKLWHNFRDTSNDQQRKITAPMIDLIDKRLANVTERFRHTYNFKIKYFFSKAPTVNNNLSNEQLQFLRQGPTYVPPCQLHLSLSSSESIFDTTLTLSAPLRCQFSTLFSSFSTFQAKSMSFEEKLMKIFHQLFSLPLPASIKKRALSEKKMVQSIRTYLKDNNLILRRTADQQNVFYLGHASDFEAKIHQYLTTADIFELVDTIDGKINTQVQKLDQIVHNINLKLKTIQKEQHIKEELLTNLRIQRSNIEFPYLYFLPQINKDNKITVQSFISCLYSPTNELAHFLDQLLRPLVSSACRSTTFRNGADFIYQLNTYTKSKDRFHSNTLFVTFKIFNFYAVLPHTIILDTLGRFLRKSLASNRLSNNLSIITVQELTNLFLQSNIFYYNGKIYRFRKGSPSCLQFTETLGNIFLLEWQLYLLKNEMIKNEFYGRYKDMIFFTFNGTKENLNLILSELNRHHPDIHIDEISLGTKLNFLNIYLENQDGHLYTSVYHDPNSQSYVLPYVIGHAQLIYCHYFRSALIRAARYCSNVYDFDQERLYIEMTFLVNGFPLHAIEYYLQRFFVEFKSLSLRMVLGQTVYDALRRTLFQLIDAQQTLLEKNQQLENNNQFFHLYYLYEWGPTSSI